MDTPETVKPNSPVEWLGPEASDANRALVERRTVVLEKDVSETDRFGRLLRYVWLVDGERWTMVDLELVARGFAQVETYPPDVKYAERFVAAQRIARDAGIGLWNPSPSSAP
jgi:micrococcal nuclease